jgi:PTH1 family peptidyl-tRNA hydrolase
MAENQPKSLKDLFAKIAAPLRSETEEPSTFFMLVGLGNPGREYVNNRHNIGFMVLDHLTGKLGTNFARVESQALITKENYKGSRLLLVKPQTFMNLSGQAVSSLAKYYKIPTERILVVFDDVDLPFGTIRIRTQGGSGGQRGMKSIIERLGTQDFPRLRVGIGRPPGRMEATDYVLQDFSKSDTEFLGAVLDQAVEAIFTFVEEGIDPTMNKFNAAQI